MSLLCGERRRGKGIRERLVKDCGTERGLQSHDHRKGHYRIPYFIRLSDSASRFASFTSIGYMPIQVFLIS